MRSENLLEGFDWGWWGWWLRCLCDLLWGGAHDRFLCHCLKLQDFTSYCWLGSLDLLILATLRKTKLDSPWRMRPLGNSIEHQTMWSCSVFVFSSLFMIAISVLLLRTSSRSSPKDSVGSLIINTIIIIIIIIIIITFFKLLLFILLFFPFSSSFLVAPRNAMIVFRQSHAVAVLYYCCNPSPLSRVDTHQLWVLRWEPRTTRATRMLMIYKCSPSAFGGGCSASASSALVVHKPTHVKQHLQCCIALGWAAQHPRKSKLALRTTTGQPAFRMPLTEQRPTTRVEIARRADAGGCYISIDR